MRFPRTAPILIALAASLLAAGVATTSSKSKPKPVRPALERRYAEMRDAYFVPPPADSATGSAETQDLSSTAGRSVLGYARVSIVPEP